jgi:predicted ATPase
VYDNAKYTVYIRISPDLGEQLDISPEQLELQSLSSGEKQIVSLFSHVYLSGQKSFFVVIDEPELSLSVPWQRRFLPDILRSGLCTGLIAVTHSPFIWENELEPYVRSLAEFTEPHHVVR